jgi:methylmalonyl-CoA mutase cobalamin-binding domain/chain
VGLSILSGAHNYLFPEIIRPLREKGADDIAVFGGGIIPKDDMLGLIEKKVKTIFAFVFLHSKAMSLKVKTVFLERNILESTAFSISVN